MSDVIFDFNRIDDRPHKHGWWAGMYFCRCRNCSNTFTGAKCSWHCSDCAYNFDDQLQYEQLWRDLGFAYSAEYITRKLLLNNK